MLAILSDIHGNLPALEAVLDDARSRGCNRFISLGDVAGYHAQPGECIDLLRQHDVINIMGNHDSYLSSDVNCPRSKVVADIIDYQRTIVTTSQLEWLRKSRPFYREDSSLYVHGGPDDPQDQYLYAVGAHTIPEDVERLFSGHTHVQVLFDFGRKVYCNPGSVGQPRDGDPRAAYAIVDGEKISLHRVSYDIDKTVFAMKSAGFDSYHYENLYIGAQIGGRIDKIKRTSKGDHST